MAFDNCRAECQTRTLVPLLWNISWWRHEMETFSALLAICGEYSPVPGEFSTQRPVMRSFDVFFICVGINGWFNTRKAEVQIQIGRKLYISQYSQQLQCQFVEFVYIGVLHRKPVFAAEKRFFDLFYRSATACIKLYKYHAKTYPIKLAYIKIILTCLLTEFAVTNDCSLWSISVRVLIAKSNRMMFLNIILVINNSQTSSASAAIFDRRDFAR